jgi:hypothetical protein
VGEVEVAVGDAAGRGGAVGDDGVGVEAPGDGEGVPADDLVERPSEVGRVDARRDPAQLTALDPAR